MEGRQSWAWERGTHTKDHLEHVLRELADARAGRDEAVVRGADNVCEGGTYCRARARADKRRGWRTASLVFLLVCSRVVSVRNVKTYIEGSYMRMKASP